jgi:hypothetical protein
VLSFNTREFGGEEFRVLYTGMPDVRELEDRIEGEIVEAPESSRLYFTVSEAHALNDYVLSRHVSPDYRPAVLETWFPRDEELDEWVGGAEYTTDSYPVQNIRGYTDLRTGKFVEHGPGWEPDGLLDELKLALGIEEEPEYFLPEDTEFSLR